MTCSSWEKVQASLQNQQFACILSNGFLSFWSQPPGRLQMILQRQWTVSIESILWTLRVYFCRHESVSGPHALIFARCWLLGQYYADQNLNFIEGKSSGLLHAAFQKKKNPADFGGKRSHLYEVCKFPTLYRLLHLRYENLYVTWRQWNSEGHGKYSSVVHCTPYTVQFCCFFISTDDMVD